MVLGRRGLCFERPPWWSERFLLDPNDLPPADEFTCMSPEEYFDLRSRLQVVNP